MIILKKTKLVALAISIILGLMLIVILAVHLQFRRAEKQYQDFISQEDKIDPLFDALNVSVYQDLPIPEGAQEIEQFSNGDHGRRMIIRYQFSNTSLENIISFYNQFFLSTGWKLNDKLNDNELTDYSYYKGTACLQFYSDKDGNHYLITIYHDYFKQSFSIVPGNITSLYNIRLHEFGESHFEQCPQ